MTGLENRKIKKTEDSTILQRLAGKDKTAVKDCVERYGNFIWTLARKLTVSREEAEIATEKIFVDIWQYCVQARSIQSIEERLIAKIALRRLIKPSAGNKFTAIMCASNEQGAKTDGISDSF